MSAMMEILKQIQRDLAEQKDYMRNLHLIHKNINEKVNLMERKIDHQCVAIEMLERQVRKNNVLLFGTDEAEIDIKGKTKLNNNESTGHLVDKSEKYIENTDSSHDLKSADVVECNPERNADEYVKMNKNEIGEFTLNEVKEIKELIREYIATTKSSDNEAGSQVHKQETVQMPKVFFDVTADGSSLGRIVIELRSDVTPKTCENFRALCTGEKGFGYKGSPFHHIGYYRIEGGDLINGDGTSGLSIYGVTFAKENFTLKHTGPGVVTMACAGPGGHESHGSIFYITTMKSDWLDNKFVAFGNVVEGMNVFKQILAMGSAFGKPSKKVIISDCGQLSLLDSSTIMY